MDSSFDDFVRARSAALLRSAFLLCGDRSEAEDLLHTALVRVAVHWDRARLAPDAYAYRVLVNLTRDRYRSAQRRPAPRALAGNEAPAGTVDPTGAVDERDALGRALAELPARQREAVTLRFLADLSVEQAAAAMGTSTGTVKTHTSRALARLRSVLADPAPDPAEARRAH